MQKGVDFVRAYGADFEAEDAVAFLTVVILLLLYSVSNIFSANRSQVAYNVDNTGTYRAEQKRIAQK
ncbi:hypothetical protein E6O75_ATG05349 [Venturia nashicola]|uniref:Uncharacterized protein n=1 Tax=Venturia nashicola TaxID=86259 RepID=A0A4Z1NZ65_9PEZI|nr:hypothetical protein E6O75_ATG05349 [Venturia nashicola]